MVKFVEMDPELIPNFSRGHRGRVSYPIIKGFLETGFALAQVDRTDLEQSSSALYGALRYYARKHKLPLSVFMREGEVYMARLDLDEEGVPKTSSAEALRGSWDHDSNKVILKKQVPSDTQVVSLTSENMADEL